MMPPTPMALKRSDSETERQEQRRPRIELTYWAPYLAVLAKYTVLGGALVFASRRDVRSCPESLSRSIFALGVAHLLVPVSFIPFAIATRQNFRWTAYTRLAALYKRQGRHEEADLQTQGAEATRFANIHAGVAVVSMVMVFCANVVCWLACAWQALRHLGCGMSPVVVVVVAFVFSIAFWVGWFRSFVRVNLDGYE
mmetsp:Transcript_33895/g.75823  ORF Transcript_33895/g.75823 Transcript_33895/m.75823 type:complete len:197 (+) Transcript_33895:38-628(+)